MKTGLTVSTVLHGALLGFGLVALSAPQALEVADVEAFPVDIIPVESITRIQRGERKAPVAEESATTPTTRPEPVPEARNVGNNNTDLESAPDPEPSPREVKTAAAPEPQPAPRPTPPSEKPAEKPEVSPAPAPATEITPQSQPRQEMTPDPVEEAAVAENPDAEAVPLPETAPAPQARPQPPQAQTAKAPERRDTEKPAERESASAPAEERSFDADQIAILLNEEKPRGGGGLRTTEQAALGGERTTTGETLTQSEMDALRGQIQRCASINLAPPDKDALKASLKFKLDRSGALEIRPEVIRSDASAAGAAFASAMARAVERCAPYDLPAEKYEAWADVVVNFDLSEMF